MHSSPIDRRKKDFISLVLFPPSEVTKFQHHLEREGTLYLRKPIQRGSFPEKGKVHRCPHLNTLSLIPKVVTDHAGLALKGSQSPVNKADLKNNKSLFPNAHFKVRDRPPCRK